MPWVTCPTCEATYYGGRGYRCPWCGPPTCPECQCLRCVGLRNAEAAKGERRARKPAKVLKMEEKKDAQN